MIRGRAEAARREAYNALYLLELLAPGPVADAGTRLLQAVWRFARASSMSRSRPRPRWTPSSFPPCVETCFELRRGNSGFRWPARAGRTSRLLWPEACSRRKAKVTPSTGASRQVQGSPALRAPGVTQLVTHRTLNPVILTSALPSPRVRLDVLVC